VRIKLHQPPPFIPIVNHSEIKDTTNYDCQNKKAVYKK